MKVLVFANGEEKKIISENGKFYVTADASYRKLNYADCVVEKKEVKEEKSSEKEAKEPAKKIKKKADDSADKE